MNSQKLYIFIKFFLKTIDIVYFKISYHIN